MLLSKKQGENENKKNMKVKVIQKLISVARFERYLIAAEKDGQRAIRLYKANLRIAQAFHPILGLFEIILRNCLNEALKKHFKDPDWTINQKHLLTHVMVKGIIDVEKRLKAKGGLVTNSKVIADQNFSFWTQQLEKQAFKKLRGSPIHAFKNLPKTMNRSDISTRLNEIRVFRNRINHNEPICFKADRINFSEIEKIHGLIHEVLDWLDHDAKKMVCEVDTVKDEIAKAKRI